MIGRIVLVASIVLAPDVDLRAYAQDVPGIEICTVEKTMERRTSCLQSNVDFLMKTITRLGAAHQQKLDAANRQIDGLKSAVVSLQKTVDDLQAAQKKPAEDTKKKVTCRSRRIGTSSEGTAQNKVRRTSTVNCASRVRPPSGSPRIRRAILFRHVSPGREPLVVYGEPLVRAMSHDKSSIDQVFRFPGQPSPTMASQRDAIYGRHASTKGPSRGRGERGSVGPARVSQEGGP